MKKILIPFVVVAAVGIVLLLYFSTFVVDETEQVVVTRFGKISGKPITTPGLKFKAPIDIANYFPKNLQEWDGTPGQIPTKDKTYIWVDAFARWRINDPVTFFQAVSTLPSATARLDDIIDSATRNYVTSYRLIETVRKSNRSLDTLEKRKEEAKLDSDFSVSTGRKEITQGIMEQASPKLERFGIELVDVKFKRINYVKEVRDSVYDRMIAERRQMAEKYRSEGRGEASEIRGDKERELKRISSEAYQKAQVIKGQADAEALKIYAKAYDRDPEFYSFLKTLDLYENSLDKSNAVVFSTDAEVFKYLKDF
ncbi:MAG: protease modulator HflC [Thermodesulfobacteriota bacterium]|nr:protease modulator HflC [Thermodesulfobacteriota bacterium]